MDTRRLFYVIADTAWQYLMRTWGQVTDLLDGFIEVAPDWHANGSPARGRRLGRVSA